MPSEFSIEPRDTQIKVIESMILYFCNDAKEHLRTLVSGDALKYRVLSSQNLVEMPEELVTIQARYDYLSTQEPLDYMNLVKTYTMFLQQISVASSYSARDDFVDKVADKDFEIKQHYDFLMCELQAKALRYSVHSYIMRRMHSKILKTATDTDTLVFKLILAKAESPFWRLTSPQSQADLA